ncbi:hypothetical protein D3C87_1825110 [compost metagenome]
MKNTKVLLTFAALLLISAESFASTGDISGAYAEVSTVGTNVTLMLPLSPTITSVELADRKIIFAAQQDAAYFVSGGEKTAILNKALHVIRSATNDFQTSDQELALTILGK